MRLRDLEREIDDGIDEIPAYDLGFDTRNDTVHELADQAVPIYTADLLALAADEIWLATEEPEIGSDGTAIGMITGNIYCHLTQYGYERLYERQQEQEEIDELHDEAEEEYEQVELVRGWISEAMLDWYDRQKVAA